MINNYEEFIIKDEELTIEDEELIIEDENEELVIEDETLQQAAPVGAAVTLATFDGHITYDWPLYLEHVKEEVERAKGYDFIVLDGVAVDKGQSQYPTVEDFAKAHWQKLVAFYEAFEEIHKLSRK